MSPSMSIAVTEEAPSADAVITRSVKPSDPSFSYHAIVSSSPDADSTSKSPSRSTSYTNTPLAPSTDDATEREVNVEDPTFSYHAITSVL